MLDKKAKLSIHQIKGAHGTVLTEESVIGEEACTFFRDLLSAPAAGDEHAMQTLLGHIPALIPQTENDCLVQELSFDEMKQAIFQLDGQSTAGADGFTGLFFTHCWEIIR